MIGEYLGHIGDGDVSRLAYNGDGEVGFEGGLIKTREGCSSKRGFKLRRRQSPNNDDKLNTQYDNDNTVKNPPTQKSGGGKKNCHTVKQILMD